MRTNYLELADLLAKQSRESLIALADMHGVTYTAEEETRSIIRKLLIAHAANQL